MAINIGIFNSLLFLFFFFFNLSQLLAMAIDASLSSLNYL